MKTWRSLLLALGLVVMAVTTTMLVLTRPEVRPEGRSVGPRVDKLLDVLPAKPWRPESTGLFVGVQKFPHDDALTVPYAVDDAVDLAYRFSLDQRSSLVP